ncbi:glycosyltransferase [Gaoshiqia sp. Z1-71]|uniref:glycosyltransferase n=1 Tax=Gaoshiqia hydrogeniformans TaxID=3290090 RepID=UPI003BF84A7B
MSVRNNEERIGALLTKLLSLDYQDYEVVVIDDFSEDETLSVIGALARQYPKLKFSSLNQEIRFSEKIAINLALKAAKSPWMVFIDPETELLDPQYLRKLNDYLGDEQAIVLNYVGYLPQRKFYNTICRVEKVYAFMTSAAYSLTGLPLFFQQSNVLFNKQIYFALDGFKGKMNAHYANLELIFNRSAKKKVLVSVDQETRLQERAGVRRSDFADLIQKRILTWLHLDGAKKTLLFVEELSKVLFVIGLAWVMVDNVQDWWVYSIPVLILIVLHWILIKTMLNLLNERKILLSSLTYVFIKPVLNLYHGTLIYIKLQRNKWN